MQSVLWPCLILFVLQLCRIDLVGSKRRGKEEEVSAPPCLSLSKEKRKEVEVFLCFPFLSLSCYSFPRSYVPSLPPVLPRRFRFILTFPRRGKSGGFSTPFFEEKEDIWYMILRHSSSCLCYLCSSPCSPRSIYLQLECPSVRHWGYASIFAVDVWFQIRVKFKIPH